MKRAVYSFVLILAIVAGVLAIPFVTQRSLSGKNQPKQRILYYTDPMHPAYRSDKPGMAPDCGMSLVPVYDGAYAARAKQPASIATPTTLSPDQQERMGLQVSTAERTAATHTVRLFGRVVPDETRLYKLIAGMDGVVRQLSTVTTGSRVTAGQWLATLSAPELRAPIQGYIVSLDVIDRQTEGGAQAPAQMQAAKEASQQALDRLLNLGLSMPQLDEIMRTRVLPIDLKVYAPADGVVLSRSVSNGQRFDKGTEWYRIADLRRVWVMADVFENEAHDIRPGQTAKVRMPGGMDAVTARVSEVLPEFDAGSRTLKVRFEIENAACRFLPDMPVDVELPVMLPPAVTLPQEAVLDSGLRSRVFIDLGDGRFESREVETGRHFDGRVQIVSGVREGERVVTAANFLLDSETQLQKSRNDKAGADGGMRR